jgi:hypothetical protein
MTVHFLFQFRAAQRLHDANSPLSHPLKVPEARAERGVCKVGMLHAVDPYNPPIHETEANAGLSTPMRPAPRVHERRQGLFADKSRTPWNQSKESDVHTVLPRIGVRTLQKGKWGRGKRNECGQHNLMSTQLPTPTSQLSNSHGLYTPGHETGNTDLSVPSATNGERTDLLCRELRGENNFLLFPLQARSGVAYHPLCPLCQTSLLPTVSLSLNPRERP